MYRHECLVLAIEAHLLHIDARKGENRTEASKVP